MLSHGPEVIHPPGFPGTPGRAGDRKVTEKWKARSHVGILTVLLILGMNRVAEFVLMRALCL